VTDVAKDIDGMEVEVVDAMKNPERALRYKIMAVPTIVINGTVKFVGLPSRDVLVRNIKEELGRRG
jgi:predicted DsbA family dithiol-disulfide isomerase